MPIRFRLGSAVALLGLFAVPALPSAGYAQARPATTRVDAGQQQSVAIFDKVWSEVAEHYYDPTYNGVDWQTVRSRYRPAALTARDDPALLDILREMLAELRDPHTRILGAQQVSDRREGRTTTSGVILFDVDGVPVVYDVIPGSAAAEAGLRPGLRVLEVNETPIAEALQRARTQVGPSTSERAS
jgi:C-terminal processing protease CtpA/Prc